MRNRGYEHYLIDACAGSGAVYEPNSKTLMDGSPLIMGEIRDRVQQRIKDKTREPQVKCVFIEVEKNTYNLLRKFTEPFSDFSECIFGDCNEKLDDILDRITSDTRTKNHFAFVYIDPFGFGKPTIKEKTIGRVLERPFTELVMHFTWEGVSRLTGFAFKHLNDPDPKLSKQASSYREILNAYLPGWESIEARNLLPHKRRREYVQLYDSRLKQYYPKTVNIEIPVGSSDPDYYLFFATRNETGNEIMTNIINSLKRKGTESLEQFVEQQASVKPDRRTTLKDYMS